MRTAAQQARGHGVDVEVVDRYVRVALPHLAADVPEQPHRQPQDAGLVHDRQPRPPAPGELEGGDGDPLHPGRGDDPMLVGAVLMSASGVVFLLEGLGATGLLAGSIVLGTGHLCAVVGQQAAVANTAGPGTFDTAFGYYTFAGRLAEWAGRRRLMITSVALSAAAMDGDVLLLPRRAADSVLAEAAHTIEESHHQYGLTEAVSVQSHRRTEDRDLRS
jgi:hypothetical protein